MSAQANALLPISSNRSGKSFLVGGIDFPTPGYWEITAHYEDDELAFIVWVAK